MEAEITTSRQRSSRRLRHEAEAQVLTKKVGDLEAIRQRLGLRPSQICEILKVHPSAWTRWVKSNQAPPHVFQMLEWYIELLGWRGQNNPNTGLPIIPKKLSREDITTYIPENEPFEFAPKTASTVGLDQGPKKYIEKKQLITILVLSFVFQVALVSAFLLLTLKSR